MKVILSILTIIFLFGCSEAPSPKRQAAFRIINETSEMIKQKYGFKFMGTVERVEHSGNYPYKELGITFFFSRKIERNEGRKILFSIADIFLDRLNNDSDIQQYLSVRPFTENNIEIMIIIENKNDLTEFDLTSLSISPMGLLFFYPNNETQETLQEAKSLIEK